MDEGFSIGRQGRNLFFKISDQLTMAVRVFNKMRSDLTLLIDPWQRYVQLAVPSRIQIRLLHRRDGESARRGPKESVAIQYVVHELWIGPMIEPQANEV
jgi:hypothetical protein